MLMPRGGYPCAKWSWATNTASAIRGCSQDIIIWDTHFLCHSVLMRLSTASQELPHHLLSSNMQHCLEGSAAVHIRSPSTSPDSQLPVALAVISMPPHPLRRLRPAVRKLVHLPPAPATIMRHSSTPHGDTSTPWRVIVWRSARHTVPCPEGQGHTLVHHHSPEAPPKSAPQFATDRGRNVSHYKGIEEAHSHSAWGGD